MDKVLYFEGAGWENCDTSKNSGVGNCRIRTAFSNKKGKKIYLEIISSQKTEKDLKLHRFDGFEVGEYIGFIDSCFYITDDPDIDDCNHGRLKVERKTRIHFTLDEILEFVNSKCYGNFDRIQVLNTLSGYNVFNDKGKHGTFSMYNYGDEFTYLPELHERMKAERNELQKKYSELFSKRFDNTSYWVNDGEKQTPNIMHVRFNISDKKLIETLKTDKREYDLIFEENGTISRRDI